MQLRSGSQLGGEQQQKQQPSATTATPPSISHKHQTEDNVHAASGSVNTSFPANAQGDTAPVPNGVSQTSQNYNKKKKGGKKIKRDKQSTTTPEPEDNSAVPTNQQRYSLRQGNRKLEVYSVVAWEALTFYKSKLEDPVATSPAEASGSIVEETTAQAVQLPSMSRNRPRGPPANRDNGIAANEEIDMWNKIIQDIRKAKEKNDKQKVLAAQIAELNEKIGRDGNKPTLVEINQLDGWYRQILKLSEEEKAILLEEPSDVIKNLGLLTALRSASEAETTTSRAASLPKSSKQSIARDGTAIHAATASNSALSSDKLNRVKGSTQRSSSVSSSGHAKDARDSVSVKLEEGFEGAAKGTIAERSGQFVVGAEVVFKHSKNRQGVEGEGIQCIIKNISGDGYKKRYDVQDPEPNENGEQGAVYKTTAASLIPIPQAGSALPSFPVGKQVLARYPDTTTFYRAEVMGSKKDVYRLKFEGEEDDKEMEVDRRFVLDIPSK